MRTTASVTSGPMPSPGISVMVCVIRGTYQISRTKPRAMFDGDRAAAPRCAARRMPRRRAIASISTAMPDARTTKPRGGGPMNFITNRPTITTAPHANGHRPGRVPQQVAELLAGHGAEPDHQRHQRRVSDDDHLAHYNCGACRIPASPNWTSSRRAPLARSRARSAVDAAVPAFLLRRLSRPPTAPNCADALGAGAGAGARRSRPTEPSVDRPRGVADAAGRGQRRSPTTSGCRRRRRR